LLTRKFADFLAFFLEFISFSLENQSDFSFVSFG